MHRTMSAINTFNSTGIPLVPRRQALAKGAIAATTVACAALGCLAITACLLPPGALVVALGCISVVSIVVAAGVFVAWKKACCERQSTSTHGAPQDEVAQLTIAAQAWRESWSGEAISRPLVEQRSKELCELRQRLQNVKQKVPESEQLRSLTKLVDQTCICTLFLRIYESDWRR